MYNSTQAHDVTEIKRNGLLDFCVLHLYKLITYSLMKKEKLLKFLIKRHFPKIARKIITQQEKPVSFCNHKKFVPAKYKNRLFAK